MTSLRPISVVHWNARGLAANQAELLLFLRSSPHLVFVCETHLSPTSSLVFPGYSLLRFDSPSPPFGGQACLIADSLASYLSPLSSSPSPHLFSFFRLLSSPSPLTLASVYFPPSSPLSLVDSFFSTLRSLPPPWLVVGDFNAHHPLWGSPSPCPRGNRVVVCLNDLGMVCLNTGAPTFHRPGLGSVTHIDLAIASSDLSHSASWSVFEDSLGSDHFPCTVVINAAPPAPSCTSAPTWILRRADWETFTSSIDHLITNHPPQNTSIQDLANFFSSALIKAAETSIPTRRPGPSRRPLVPWWSDECATAVREKRRAYRSFRRSPTPARLDHYRRACALARRTTRQAQKNCWRDFCSTLSHRTPLTEVWRKLHLVNFNKTRNATYLPHLPLEDKFRIFAEQFTTTTPEQVLTEERRSLFSQYTQDILNANCQCNTIMCLPINKNELNNAIRDQKPTTPGPDNIHSCFLKHLSDRSKTFLLDICNHSLRSATLPDDWTTSITIPILKPGRPPDTPDSFRPVSLTSTLCRILERVIHTRLYWFLCTTSNLSPRQFGFSPGHSVHHNHLLLENTIRSGFERRQHTLVCFLDISRAFDSVWHDGLLHKCRQTGIPLCILKWIHAFLNNRTFCIKIGQSLSHPYPLRHGTPQGSVLSPLLFNIMVGDLPECLPPGIGVTLYADDLCIWTSDKDLTRAACNLQDALDALEEWADTWGFEFSATKSRTVPFSRRHLGNIPTLRINGGNIPTTPHHTFLGITFDQRLTWNAHLQTIQDRCGRRLNILRYLCGRHWGADRKTLLNFYCSYIRPILDYSAPLFLSAGSNFIHASEVIQAKCLRVVCGLPSSTPHIALQVETGIPPLQLRRKIITTRLLLRALQVAPTSDLVSILKGYLDNHSTTWRFSPPALYLGASLLRPHLPPSLPLSPPLETPYWYMQTPPITIPDIVTNRHSSTSITRTLFYEAIHPLQDHDQLYTDGSYDPTTGVSSSSVWIPEHHVAVSTRLPQHTGIFLAELHAILMALRHIQTLSLNNAVIFTDSQAALKAIANPTIASPTIIRNICNICHSLLANGAAIILHWVPAHCGIPGNEEADRLASSPTDNADFPFFHVTSQLIHSTIDADFREWQSTWDLSPHSRHLHAIKNTIKTWNHLNSGPRHITTTISRLRTGHCNLRKHLNQHGGSLPPNCRFCNLQDETVEHILLHCPALQNQRTIHITPLLNNCPSHVSQCKYLLSGGSPSFDQYKIIYSAIYQFIEATHLKI